MKTISTLFLIAILWVHISSLTLLENNSIATGGSLLSDNGVFTLSVQGDGNVVVYGCKGIAATWATGTNNSSAKRYLTMQGDGNLVLYENGVPKWSSGTVGKGTGPYKLYMQDDGNLVIYASTGPIWASGTVGQGYCQLCAYFHDATNAGTSSQIKLSYYDFGSQYLSECYLNGTKNKATTYCCTPTAVTIDRTTSPGVGTRYIKVQIYGNDLATIGSLKVFGRQLEYFYQSGGYAYFSISTGDGVVPVVVTDIDNYKSVSGHACYLAYSYSG
jgi:hypothetical protein